MSVADIPELPLAEAPPLVAETFGNRTVFEMELALQQACEMLPPELNSHTSRCFVARRILSRVGGGDRTFGGLVAAGLAAVEALRCRYEGV